MSADNDRLMYSRDPKHAKEPATYGGNDALFGGSVTPLSEVRSRDGEMTAAGPPISEAPAPSVMAPDPTEAETTTKIQPIPPRPPWPPQDGLQPVDSWSGVGTGVGLSEHRAVDNLARVGVRPTVKMHSQRGWRGLLYRTTRVNLGLSRDERYELDLYARIRRNAREAYQIGVFGLKGGVGKTAITVALGSMLSKVRGDRILAIDADPASGNLADRAGRQSSATVADLLAAEDLSRYNDVRGFTSINESKLEVLSSMEYSAATRAFNDADWKAATDIVSRHYNLVVADCAADMFQPAARGVLSSVSGAVIVASASIDGARQAAVTLDWLWQNGYRDLLNRTCVVINHIGSGRPNVDTGALVTQFQKHLPPGRVFVLPWDKHVAGGTEIHLDLLRPRFQRRILELAAALSDDFDGSIAT
ncbi:MinD/ParA family protein [Mycobacterium sp. 141]|uniref:MinD/ParA family ATP-binding protein n=1 Tax=Mycobacterium sp. 141 TaxID=1120797 RepID=UPI00037766C5|nr:MinD/ParA family protein [Mycobacterium sp. 141]